MWQTTQKSNISSKIPQFSVLILGRSPIVEISNENMTKYNKPGFKREKKTNENRAGKFEITNAHSRKYRNILKAC